MALSDFAYYILQLIYLMLPGIFANMMPIFAAKLNILKSFAIPVDFNKKWFDNKPVLGSHKTFRGFVTGIIISIVIVYLQVKLDSFEFFQKLSIIPYNQYSFFTLGFLLGFGVLFGDSVKSFFKRRLDIKPGKPFIPFDQIDSVLGAILFVSIIYIPTIKLVISLIVLSILTHFTVRTIGYYLSINKERW